MADVVLVRRLARRGGSITGATLSQPIVFDANVSESHRDSVTPTRNPVEDGVAVTDHVQTNPVELDMEVVVTNTPLDESEWVPERAATAYQRLRELLASHQLVSVITGLRIHRNMLLTSVTVNRGSPGRQEVRPQLKFTEIRVVSPETVKVPDVGGLEESDSNGGSTRSTANCGPETAIRCTTDEDAQGDSDRGRQQPTEANDQTRDRGASVAVRLFG